MRSEPVPTTARRALQISGLMLTALSAWSCSPGSSDINIGFSDGAGARAGAGPIEPVEPCVEVWGPLEPLVELNTPRPDCGGHITPDGLTYYFDSEVSDNNWDLLVARRADRRAPFSAPTPLTELNTAGGEADPTTTPDELELFFSGNRDGPNCLYQATRSTPTEPWGAPTRLNALCPVPSVAPSLSADGLTLYYNTTEEAFGVGTVMVSVRASRSDAFGAPAPVPSFTGGEPHSHFGYPSLSPDGLRLFVSTGASQLDIWLASRESTDQAFGAPAPVSELNSAALDGDASVTADGSELFLASGRSGSVDLYVSRRGCR